MLEILLPDQEDKSEETGKRVQIYNFNSEIERNQRISLENSVVAVVVVAASTTSPCSD